MAYVTRKQPLTDTWALVTNKVAMIQFNDKSFMQITSGEEPTGLYGFNMDRNEKYINSRDGISIWVKVHSKSVGGPYDDSVIVLEDITE